MIKRFLVALALLWLSAQPAGAASNNILFLLADDMGVDVSVFYRTSVRTATTPPPVAPPMPNLASLANGGLLFTRMWSTPWCSPTRASVMTGRYGFRHGLGVPVDQSIPQVILAQSEVVLPEIVGTSSRNYVMRHIGKWHLSEGTNDPRVYGWTTWTGPHPGAGGPATTGTGGTNNTSYTDWGKYVGGASGSTRTQEMTYATTDQVDEAIATITAADAANRPYFLWVAFNAPHSPFHKPPNDLHSRDSLPVDPNPDDALKRDYYEATLEALDTEIGRLLAEVDLATTTVIFMGDNGTPTNIAAAPYTAGHGKGTIYNDGSHVPFIVAGQGVTGGGRYVNELVNCVDLFPTILELAGVDPTTVAALSGVKIDGITLTPYLRNRTHPTPRRWIYSEEFIGTWNDSTRERTIRNADYVLIERGSGTTREFYNIALDPLQATNILARTRTAIEQANLDALDAQLDALLATR